MNTIGENLKLTVYGESHGVSVGAVLDGLPPGETVDWDEVRREMARRAPGKNSMSTSRAEGDDFAVQSGYCNGHTTGTPLAVMIANSDVRSGDYDDLRHLMRPGHADYTGKIRYGGYNDYRGGGHFSGRLTAPIVFAGAVAKQILARRGIRAGAHILQIEKVTDRPFNPLGEEPAVFERLARETLPVLDKSQAGRMAEVITAAKEDSDSVGGCIEAMITGLPAGYGDPLFDSVESGLARMLFAVPAVKGLSFGDGFALAAMRGSVSNDAMYYDADGTVRTKSNHNGGINGGITNGMPVLFRTVIKAAASIGKEQDTVDTDDKKNAKLIIKGRHDPCIVQRAVPVIENAAAWTILDILLTQGGRYT